LHTKFTQTGSTSIVDRADFVWSAKSEPIISTNLEAHLHDPNKHYNRRLKFGPVEQPGLREPESRNTPRRRIVLDSEVRKLIRDLQTLEPLQRKLQSTLGVAKSVLGSYQLTWE